MVQRRPFSTTQSSYLSLSLTRRSSYRRISVLAYRVKHRIKHNFKFAQICIRVLKGYSTHRDAVDDTQEILNQLGTHCNTGENEQFFFPRVRRNYPTRAVAYYANSIAARRIILSGDVVVNPGPTEGTESQGALQNKQNRARPKSNWLIRLNCRSLLQNIDEMGLIFTCNRPFMIAVTETWLNNTISNDEIHIQG